MTDIDWSKAPEGATHYCSGDSRYSPHWHKPGYFCVKGFERNEWVEDYSTESSAIYIEKPVAEEWNGIGLPPVGVVCEIEHHREWVRCEILAHKTFNDLPGLVHAIAWIDKDTVDQSSGIRFRPIRTHEQIAAAEREHKIRNACTAISTTLNGLHESEESTAVAIIEAMIDAGYHKGDDQ